MRIMYVLHRYHTNQIAIMKGWKAHGDELKLLTWYTGKVEDHTAVVPETLRPFCTTSVLCGQSRLISNMILCTASSGAAARNTESLRQGRSGLT